MLCAAVLLAACTSEQDRYDEHRAAAEAYFEEGQVAEAVLELRSALELRPKDAPVNMRIAETLLAAGNIPGAIFFFGEAYRLDPTNAEAALSKAMLLRTEQMEEAEALVEEIILKFPESPLGYVGRSRIALERADTAAALRAALTAVELAPENAETQHSLGVVQQARIREGEVTGKPAPDSVFESAIEAFERAAELRAPATVWTELIDIAQTLAAWEKRADEAPAAYRRAVETARGSGHPSNLRAALLRTSRYARAKGRQSELYRWTLEELIALDPSVAANWRELALLEAQQGGDADEVIERFIATRPQDAGGHLLLAGHWYESGERERAIAYLEEQAAAGVQPPVLLGAVARMHFSRRDYEAGQEVVERLRRDYPAHRATALAGAQLAVSQERPLEAVEILEAQLQRQGGDAEALQLLADAQLRAGNPGAALDAVERAIQASREPSRVLLRLRARAQAKAGDCEAALISFSRFRRGGGRASERARPISANLRPNERLDLAECYYTSDRPDQARVMMEQLVRPDEPPVGAVVAYAVYEGERSPERARELLESALSRNPGDRRLIEHLAVLDLQQKRYADAKRRLDALLAEEAEARALLLRAQAQLGLNDTGAARADALAAYELDSAMPGPLVLVAHLDTNTDRAAETAAMLEALEGTAVFTPTRRAALARLYLAQGDTDRARQQYQRVVAADPDDLIAKNQLAFLLAESGQDLELALRYAEDAQRGLGDLPEVVDTVGYVYLRRGLAQAALQQFDFAIELAGTRPPERPKLHYHRGLALQELGRGEEAVRAFSRALEMDAGYAPAQRALEEVSAAGGSPGSG